MRKLIVAATCAAIAFGASAELRTLTPEERKLIDTPVNKLTQEERAKRVEAVRLDDMISNGGTIDFPGTPSGTIRYVNLQKRVPTDDLKKALRVFGGVMNYDAAIVETDCAATLKVKIVDDPAAPVMLVAPEDKWAQINVARLGDAQTKPAFLAARVRKEMIRAFAFLTGGSSSEMPLYRPIRTVADLDQMPERGFAGDVAMRARNYLEHMGLSPREKVSYRAAVANGYDIAPTNEYQKVIYEELKKTIKLDKKVK